MFVWSNIFRFLGVLVALWSASCSDRVIRRFELPAQDIDAAFLIVTGPGGSVARISEVFSISSGGLRFGALPHFELDDDEDEVLLIALDASTIAADVPAFDQTKIGELRAVVEPAPQGQLLEGEGAVRVAFPGETELSRVDFAESKSLLPFDGNRNTVIDSVSLVVPIDPERCRISDLEPMTPFSTRAHLELPSERYSSEYRNFSALKTLSRDTVMTISDFIIRVVKRGEPAPLSPATRVEAGAIMYRDEFQDPPGRDLRFYGMDYDPRLLPDGRYRVVVSAADVRPDPNDPIGDTFGVIWVLTVGDQLIEEVLRLYEYGEPLLSVAFDDQGTAALIGQGGGVLLLAPDNTVTELPRIEDRTYSPQIIIHTKDQDRPWLIGGRGAVYLYDARVSQWEPFTIPLTMFDDALGRAGETSIEIDALAAARTPSGELELWAGGSAGALLRRVGDGGWTVIDLVMPPRFQPCAYGGQYPDLFFGAHIDAMIVDRDHVIATLRSCTAVMEVRRADQCVALLGEEGTPIELRLNRDLQAIDIFESSVVVGGEQSVLLTTER